MAEILPIRRKTLSNQLKPFLFFQKYWKGNKGNKGVKYSRIALSAWRIFKQCQRNFEVNNNMKG